MSHILGGKMVAEVSDRLKKETRTMVGLSLLQRSRDLSNVTKFETWNYDSFTSVLCFRVLDTEI